jgi:hypothetical protein
MAVEPTRTAKIKTVNRAFLPIREKIMSSPAASATLNGATALCKSAPHQIPPPRAIALKSIRPVFCF